MTLFFFVVGNGFIMAYLVFDYRRSQARIFQLKQQVESERRLKEAALVSVQARDDSTRLPGTLSRQAFDTRLSEQVLQSVRYQFNLGVMFVGMDAFNVVCDALGREVSDTLVLAAMERLASCLREVDAAYYAGKGVFIVMLTQLAKPETAVIVAQRVLQSLAEVFQLKEHEVPITTSIGVATFPADGKDAATLLTKAEFALNLVQAQGGHACRFYQDTMQTNSQRELALYTSLSRDTFYQELTLSYQPIVNIRDNTILCMDVLLSWQHPQFGKLEANELFAYAERQRKWNEISVWVLSKACQQFLAWRECGFKPQFLGISLSIKQIESSQFIYQVSHVLKQLQFDPKCLLIEMKESFAEVSFDILEKSFNRLNYLGVQLAIADFGVDALSLCYLKSFYIAYMKLTPMFVSDMIENAQTHVLVESVLMFAKNMSMRVIAQGVELEQQMTILKAMGCELLQGAALSAPILGEAVVEQITGRKAFDL